MSLSDNITNNTGSVVTNADCEVQKLKDLVKKLERQNQHLRYKTGKLSPHSKTDLNLGNRSSSDESKIENDVKYKHISEDNVIESDLQALNVADDTDWLYSPSKTKPSESRKVLETWLRDELEHPATPELARAKKTILSSLDTPYGYERIKFESPALKQPSSGLNNTVDKSDVTSLSYNSPLERKLFSSHDGGGDTHDQSDLCQSKPASGNDKTTTSHHVHHMPLPSHTMTSVHGLIPSDGSIVGRHRQRSPSPSTRSRGMQRNARDSPSLYGNKKESSRRESPARRKESPMRRQSPATRGESPGRRESPSRRESPVRRIESPARHMGSPARRMESPARRMESPSQRIEMESPVRRRESPSRRTSSPANRVRESALPGRRIQSPSTDLGTRRSINRSAPDLRKEDLSSGSSVSSDQTSKRRSNIGRMYTSGLPQASSGYGRTTNTDSGTKQKSRIGRQIKPPSHSPRVSARLTNSESGSEPSSPRSGIARPQSQSSTPRRSLPRPSQASRNQYYSSNNEQYSKYSNNSNANNNVGEGYQLDDVQFETRSEGSDVWKDGDFF